MRIGVLHSFYRSTMPSGENVAVRQQVSALRSAGIEVVEFVRESDESTATAGGVLRAAKNVCLGTDKILGADLELSDIDLLHVHNTFPNFGIKPILAFEGPVVFTIHNYRSICANGLLYREGQYCAECLKSPAYGLRHGCYRNSRLKTAPIFLGSITGSSSKSLLERSDTVIVQSEFAYDLYRNSGLVNGELVLIPGFTESSHDFAVPMPKKERYIFVGRNTPEKGLDELLEIWPSELPLDVIGADESSSNSFSFGNDVRFLGTRNRAWIQSQIQEYRALIFPGLVQEGAYPIVVREALEAGVPVIALKGSSAAQLVESHRLGFTYYLGSRDSLNDAIQRCSQAGNSLRLAARQFFETSMTEEAWLSRMLETYDRAISNRV